MNSIIKKTIIRSQIQDLLSKGKHFVPFTRTTSPLEIEAQQFAPDFENIFDQADGVFEAVDVMGRELHDVLSDDGVMVESVTPFIDQSVKQRQKDLKVKAKLETSLELLFVLLEFYGLDRTGCKTRSTLLHWQKCSAECGWIKFLKYKFAAFFSHYLKLELPPCPFPKTMLAFGDCPGILVGGRAGRFLNRMMKGKNGLELAVSLLYMKKGLPRPDEEDLFVATVETFKVLTEEHPVIPTHLKVPHFSEDAMWEEVNPTRPFGMEDLRLEVVRTIQEVFKGHEITDEDLHRPYAPSVKSNYLKTRLGLGTFGALLEHGYLSDANDFRYAKNCFQVGDNPIQDSESLVVGGRKVEIPEVRINPDLPELIKDRYKSIYESVRSDLNTGRVNEGNEVTLVALPEALKIRVISKGPPLKYFLLKPVQKFLHGIMRKHPTFRLIGEPVTVDFLQKTFSHFDGDWLSVDYKSATDLLNPELSRLAVDTICDVIGLPDDLREFFHIALTGHVVEYLDKESKETVSALQKWGQLMGSIVSFIVLCLINAAVCRCSYEIGQKEYGLLLKDIPLTVNGDDALLKCKDETRVAWEQISRLGGLEPSVGKVYFHTNYLNINSTSFWWLNGELTHIPYINMGLLVGQTRSGGKNTRRKDKKKDSKKGKRKEKEVDIEDVSTIGARSRELIKTCPWELRESVLKQFIQLNWETLSKCKVPWFVPESMGGLGLVCLMDDTDLLFDKYLTSASGFRYGPSDADLKCLRILFNKKVRLPFKSIPMEQPIVARGVWFQNKGFDIPMFYETVDLFPDQSFSHLSLAEEEISSLLDTSTYYLQPTILRRSMVDQKPLNILNRNRRAWGRLFTLSLSQKNLKGFSYLKDTVVSRPAKYVVYDHDMEFIPELYVKLISVLPIYLPDADHSEDIVPEIVRWLY
jgi:hypothetical protein